MAEYFPDEVLEIISQLEAQECFSFKDLAITGNDLKQLGLFGKKVEII